MKFSELLLKLKTDATSEIGDLIKQAGILLEIHYSSGNDASISLLDEELAKSQIGNQEVEELIGSLLDIAAQKGGTQSAAIWAIGKSRRSDLVKSIINIVEDSANDDVVYQALVAVEDCDINQAWSFIEQMAHSLLPKSKEFALRKLELKSMGVYEG